MERVAEEREILKSSESLLTSWQEMGIQETVQSLPLSAYGLLMKILEMDDEGQQSWKARVAGEDPAVEKAASGLLELCGRIFEEDKEEEQPHSFFRFDEAITGLDFEALLPLSGELLAPIIRLLFLGGKDYERVLLTSDQDIEDTLRLGQAILGVVGDVLKTAEFRGVTVNQPRTVQGIPAILSDCEEIIGSIRRAISRAHSPQETGHSVELEPPSPRSTES